MAILNKKDVEWKKATIDLTGPDGNAFALLGICRQIAKDLKIDWDPISKDATSDDYEHLLEVLQRHFGDYVDFIR